MIQSFVIPTKGKNFANWTERTYLINKGILYRYSPEFELEEDQLIIPNHETERVLK